MFITFANLIRVAALACILSGPLPCAGADSSGAKGGSLTVRTNDGRKHFTLSANAHWVLETKERFDASALAFYGGKLITVNDQTGEFFEIDRATDDSAKLKRLDLFPKASLSRVAPRRANRYDLEGISVDSAGNIYVSEESQRVVFKHVAETRQVESLTFDWSMVSKHFSADRNASFEGIAVAGDRLFLANERSAPRIIVIDLPSRKVTDSFAVDSDNFAFGGAHYSDLAYFEGRLFILDRNHRCIFEVEPETKKVIAEYSFAKMELTEEFAYRSDYPTGGMEGLAVEKDYFWLLTDNNGKGRFKFPQDTRPILFRCQRPGSKGAR